MSERPGHECEFCKAEIKDSAEDWQSYWCGSYWAFSQETDTWIQEIKCPEQLAKEVNDLQARLAALESWRDGDRADIPLRSEADKWFLDNIQRLSIAELFVHSCDAMRRYDWGLFYIVCREIERRERTPQVAEALTRQRDKLVMGIKRALLILQACRNGKSEAYQYYSFIESALCGAIAQAGITVPGWEVDNDSEDEEDNRISEMSAPEIASWIMSWYVKDTQEGIR